MWMRKKASSTKYMGDAVLAFWGAPSEQSDHAERACRAALGIARAIGEDNTARRRDGLSPLWVRIGIHSGPVVVGNIGAPSRVNYTIVGDTVNTAQRLEELSRRSEEEVSIVVGGETAQHLGSEFRLASLGRQVLRGRHEPLEVFRLQIPNKAADSI
jgi:class 3 adenylate cyclase